MTVLAVSTDQSLVDGIRRLVTASAQELHCVDSVEQAQSSWSGASLVFLGIDQLATVRSAAMPKRDRLLVVAHSGAVDTVWREAMSVGAAYVVQLPDDESWVADQLAQIAADEGRQGLVVGVVGGSGGVGCSSFVAACAAAALRLGKSPVVVDLDPVGCGLDVVLGSDEVQPGVRWSELYRVSGRVPGKSLVDSLPSPGEVPVLSWGDSPPQLPSPEAIGVVLDSMRTTFDLVFLDLPRASHEFASAALARANVVALVTRAGVIGGLAAKRTSRWVLRAHSTVDLLVRPQSGTSASAADVRDVAELLRIEPLLVIPDCKDVMSDLELGRLPGSNPKSKLGQVATDYVQGLDQLRDEV